MYDIIFKNGTVVDGTRAKSFVADVAVKDGVIAEIAEDCGTDAKRVIDIKGKIISPGFIDIHTHSDKAPFILKDADSKTQQGITTEIGGNCGTSNIPATKEHFADLVSHLSITEQKGDCAFISISDYAQKVDETGYLNNIGMLIGHGAIRIAVVGFSAKVPDSEELAKMEQIMEDEMKRGAFGMSLGLIYPPSAFGQMDELVALSKVVAKYNGILAVHMRNENNHVFEAFDEVIEIAKASGVRVEISHLKLMGKPQWGKSAELLKKITDAKAAGVDIFCDQYPFIASHTGMKALLPDWAHEGGRDAMLKRVKNADEKLRQDTVSRLENRGGASTVQITVCPGCPQYEGKFVSELSEQFGLDDISTVYKVLLESGGTPYCAYFCMDEKDMLNLLPQMFISVGSDGSANRYDVKNNPHPRNYGTFPQYYQLVREHNLLSIEDAVYKTTGLPASVLGIKDRGILKKGLVADITVFDKDTIKNNADFKNSKVKPDGIEFVVINGKIAIENKKLVAACCGKMVLHK